MSHERSTLVKKIFSCALITSFIYPVAFFAIPQKVNAQAGILSGCVAEFTGFSLGDILGGMKSKVTGGISGAVSGGGITAVPTTDAITQQKLEQANIDRQKANIKENCLDKIAIYAAKTILHNITNSIIAWANNGFDGNPAFMTDFGGFMKNMGSQIAGGLIEGSELDFLCSPFKFNIRFNLSQRTRFPEQIGCTLEDIAGNITDFANEPFSVSGWETFYTMTNDPQNNPYGAQFLVQTELDARTNYETGKLGQELSWGNGWLSTKDENGNIVTPGSTIEDAVSQALGTDMRQLELAQEFDEVIDAITGALMKKAVGATGLLGS